MTYGGRTYAGVPYAGSPSGISWVAKSNAVVSASTDWAHYGTYSLKVVSIAAGDMSAAITKPATFAVTPHAIYLMSGWAHAASSGGSHGCRLLCDWYDSGGGSLGTSTTITFTDSSTVDTFVSGVVVAPADAASADLSVQNLATAGASEAHYWDHLYFGPTTAAIQTAAARIQLAGSATQPSTARIKISASAAQTAVSRVVYTFSATQLAAARVVRSRSITQSAAAWVAKPGAANQQAVARVQAVLTSTQSGQVRIQRIFTKTQPAGARIALLGSKIQSAVAKITPASATYTSNQTAVARISLLGSATHTAVARVTTVVSRTTTAKTRVALVRTRTQAAAARIGKSLAATQGATSRIAASRTVTQQARTRIQSVGSRTQIATVRVRATFTATHTAKSEITRQFTKAQTGTARLSKILTLTQTGRSALIHSASLIPNNILSWQDQSFDVWSRYSSHNAQGRVQTLVAASQLATASITSGVIVDGRDIYGNSSLVGCRISSGSLTVINGDYTITNGANVSGLWIKGDLVCSSVTSAYIADCIIDNRINNYPDGGLGMVGEYLTVGTGTTGIVSGSPDEGLRFGGGTWRYCDFHGCTDVVKVNSPYGTVLDACWLHGNVISSSGAHSDVVQQMNGTGAHITRCWLDCNDEVTDAAFIIGADAGDSISDCLIDRNLITSSGGATPQLMVTGDGPPSALPSPGRLLGLQFTNNWVESPSSLWRNVLNDTYGPQPNDGSGKFTTANNNWWPSGDPMDLTGPNSTHG